MPARPIHPCTLAVGLAGLLMALASGSAAAQMPAPGTADKPQAQASASAQQRYERERADCLAGRSPQAQATCLKEAAAARAEASRPARESAAQTDAELQRNQRQRCEPLPPADRHACLARMAGAGSTRGSVAEGGLIRELRTVIPGAAAGSASGAAAAASGRASAPK